MFWPQPKSKDLALIEGTQSSLGFHKAVQALPMMAHASARAKAKAEANTKRYAANFDLNVNCDKAKKRKIAEEDRYHAPSKNVIVLPYLAINAPVMTPITGKVISSVTIQKFQENQKSNSRNVYVA